MNQRGFATLEVILMVMVIGILASIAVPRFTSVTAAANTAKIQSDLTTIDTAIAIHQMEKGTDPANVQALVDAKYLQSEPEPPTGQCYMGEENSTKVPATSYTFSGSGSEMRAVCGENNTADKFHLKKAQTTTGKTGE